MKAKVINVMNKLTFKYFNNESIIHTGQSKYKVVYFRFYFECICIENMNLSG